MAIDSSFLLVPTGSGALANDLPNKDRPFDRLTSATPAKLSNSASGILDHLRAQRDALTDFILDTADLFDVSIYEVLSTLFATSFDEHAAARVLINMAQQKYIQYSGVWTETEDKLLLCLMKKSEATLEGTEIHNAIQTKKLHEQEEYLVLEKKHGEANIMERYIWLTKMLESKNGFGTDSSVSKELNGFLESRMKWWLEL